MILDTIVAAKRREVDERKAARPLADLERTVAELPPTRDFAGGLAHGGIIAEVKRRSPSRGMLREGLDPVGIARTYQAHGAAAISVLTDAPFFGGSEADLAAVRTATSLPILRKEFILDAWQIFESRVAGADAILLIAAILPDRELRNYRELAAALGLEALVEVHDRPELDRALASDATLVGINNRNLQTFVTDLGTSLDLAPLIPSDRIAVSESGIGSRADIERLRAAGIGTFLVGETLIAAADPGRKLEELLG